MSSRGWRSAPRDLSTASWITQVRIDARSGVDARPDAVAHIGLRIWTASTSDRRRSLASVTQFASGRSLAVCAARDDTHFDATHLQTLGYFQETETLKRSLIFIALEGLRGDLPRLAVPALQEFRQGGEHLDRFVGTACPGPSRAPSSRWRRVRPALDFGDRLRRFGRYVDSSIVRQPLRRERLAPGQQLIEHRAAREDVRPLIDDLAP